MCYKTIYHNTYADGVTDITERVDQCTPGYVCPHIRVREFSRQLNYPKYQTSSGRTSPSLRPAPYLVDDRHIRPPSPLTPPGSRGGSDNESRRRPSSKTYFDGKKWVTVRRSRSRSPPRRRDSLRPVVFAPEPPAPTRPIPIMKRASTMPWSSGIDTPPAEQQRGRRPIIVEDRVATPPMPASPAVGPVEIVEHATSGRHRSRRESDAYLHPSFAHRHHRRRSSPQGYGSAEDDAERKERRRRRREAKAQAAVMATSMPAFGNTDVFGSSYGSSNGDISSGASSPVVGPSAAVTAVKKELRWEDQQRAQQNERIASRPKLSRSATATGTPATTEVRGILKNSPAGGSSPVFASSSSPRRSAADDLDDLMKGLSLDAVDRPSSRDSAGKGKESSTERRARRAADRDAEAQMERLRNRFSMPPRRFTAGSGARRRTEVWYPEERVYKYM